MTVDEAVKWLASLGIEIGQMRYRELWPYAQAIGEIIEFLENNYREAPCLEREHLGGDKKNNGYLGGD